MNKFTIIVSEVNRRANTHWTVTTLHRVLAENAAAIINSDYGDSTVFILQGWPLQDAETTENGYNLPIITIDPVQEIKS